MRQILKITFVASLIFCSCLDHSRDSPLTKFKGRIDNLPEGEFSVKLKYFDLVAMEEVIVTLDAPINTKGEFELETDEIVDNVWHVSMWIGKEVSQAVVFPGDDLAITVNADRFDESIKYKGKGAAKNNYKAKRYLINEQKSISIKPDLFGLSFEEFIDGIDEANKELVRMLDSVYVGQKKDAFYEMEKLNLQNDLMLQILMYEKQHHYADYDKAKAILMDMNPSGNSVVFHYPWHRRSIANYVRFMAGVAPSDLMVYQTAKEILSGDALRYFYKNEVTPLLLGDDAAIIIAEIKASSANEALLARVDKFHKYQMSLKEEYPNKQSRRVCFSEGLLKSTMKITCHINKYDEVTKIATIYDSGLGGKERIDSEIASDGTFAIDIPVYYSHEISLKIGSLSQHVLINPDGKLHIEIDGLEIQYYGDGAEENVVLNDYVKASKIEEHPYSRNDLLEVDPNEIKRAFIDRYEQQLIFVSDYFSDGKTPIIKDWALVEAMRDNFMPLYGFESYRKYINKKKGVDLISIPEGFYDFDEIVDITGTSLISSKTVDLIKAKSTRYADTSCENDVERTIHSLDESLKSLNQFEYEMIFTNTMYEWIYAKDFEVVDAITDRYIKEISTEWLVNDMKDRIELEKEILAGFVIPEGADLNNLFESSGERLLTSILSKHKGKVIYIDMWATWCGPCIKEFAFASDFYKEIDHDKVAVVYLAGESKESIWKSMIGKHKLEGDHYLLSAAQNGVISTKFDVRGFPHYVIIDQHGIVKYKDAPRPSVRQKKLNETLIKVLNTL